MRSFKFVLAGVFVFLGVGVSTAEILHSPKGDIEVTFLMESGKLTYSLKFNKEEIISPSALGLTSKPSDTLELIATSQSSFDETWKPVWGSQSQIRNYFNEIQLELGKAPLQTVVFRAYDDGVAFRYEIPEGQKFSAAYAHEATEINFVSEEPRAWFPLTPVLVSDEIDINTWEPAKEGKESTNRNARYDYKPSTIKTPFTVKLSDETYISVHEAAVIQSNVADVRLNNRTLTYNSKVATSGGRVTPWRTVSITQNPGQLIESSLLLNLNEPSKIEDTSWIKPGVTMWDWRNHGAYADDGFEYHINTESYIRYIDFAAEVGVEFVLIDAEWYGPERSKASDPKTPIPDVDIEKVCAYAKSKGVGMWLYINTKALQAFDVDATLSLYQKWGVVGIKQGFSDSSSRSAIEHDIGIVKKCAEYELMYIRHEASKPTGVNRTYPNVMSYEFVNSMLDSGTRPAATPSRVINGLFAFGIAGPVDRSCGMFDLDSFIVREKCHRQLPSTVVSQVAQCMVYPSGLVTLPDIPDAYRRKSDLFEFIAKLQMTWDQTIALEAEIGQYITLARQAGDEWFVGALANEAGRKTNLTFDFLEEGVTYDLTLYEDAPGADYKYIGPMNKREAKAKKIELVAQKTNRELYQVKKITAKKGDVIPVVIAPGGGHCMWIRPQITK
ncbi:MAG: glycoside hydrolase family 97 catalytic domain-containing protein [Akkermansiaceae bacterium]